MRYEATDLLVRRNMRDIFRHFPIDVKFLFVHRNIEQTLIKQRFTSNFVEARFIFWDVMHCAGAKLRANQYNVCFHQTKQSGETR
jgi:hypothetical protein